MKILIHIMNIRLPFSLDDSLATVELQSNRQQRQVVMPLALSYKLLEYPPVLVVDRDNPSLHSYGCTVQQEILMIPRKQR
jgi:hypothetical protein